MNAPFKVVALDASYDRSAFNSGSEPLDNYFQKQVTQDIKRRVTACFIAVTHENRIAGFYTLASSSMLLSDLPQEVLKKLPRYPSVPAVRMGRLAVDQNFKGQGIGGILLINALLRSAKSEIAAYALVVDAKDETASSFYKHHGFIAFPNAPLVLFMPLATISKLAN
jgi:ribosomal protein S18 acetylase RimI-like enzyme